MTLEEAIKHAEAAAIENEKEAKRKREHGGWYYDSEARACAICAEENRQLADWLRELQERRNAPEIIRCGECKYREIRGVEGFCDHITGEEIMVRKTDYCSWAERRINDSV